MTVSRRIMWGAGAIAVVMLLLGSILPAAAQTTIPRAARPDIHLTFEIHADGSNQMLLEIAVHPLVDPAVRQALVWLQPQLPQDSTSTRPAVELRDTTRDGRKYAALVTSLNSIGDLNALINTPQLFSDVLGRIDPGIGVPGLFTWFEVKHDSTNSPPSFRISALMGAATTRVLDPINLTIHVRFPFTVQEHNANKITGTELSWQMIPGEPLNIVATASRRSLLPVGGTGSQGGTNLQWPWIVGGVALLVLLVAGIGIFVKWRAGREDTIEDETQSIFDKL